MIFKQIAFPLLAVLIWAINTNVNKLAAGIIDPAAISFYRWLLAALLLSLFVSVPVWRARRQVWPLLPKFFVLGVLGMVLYQCLAYVAAETTSATHMGIVASLMPVLAMTLGVLFLGEALSIGALLGAVLSLAGLIYLMSAGAPLSLLSGGVAVGDGLMLLASFAYAAYSVLLKRWNISLPLWHSLFMQISCALPVLLAYYLIQGAPPLTRAGLPLVLFAGIPASVLAPFLWMLGVARLGPARTTMLMNLLPVFTVLIAIVFLGEHLHGYDLIGSALTLAGVLLAQSLRQPVSTLFRGKLA